MSDWGGSATTAVRQLVTQLCDWGGSATTAVGQVAVVGLSASRAPDKVKVPARAVLPGNFSGAVDRPVTL